MRKGHYALAGLSWLCLLTWLAILASGGGKSALDYATQAIVEPLGPDETLLSSDQRHAMWSGWWAPGKDGARLSTAVSPDILFRWNGQVSSCALYLHAFAMLRPGHLSQAVYVKINEAPLVGPVQVSTDGAYRFDGIGSVRPGINILTFWLPDAGPVNGTDERLLSLGLRSAKLSCGLSPTSP